MLYIITGTLKAAKKQNLVDFKGQMLLKGAHDNVIIYLLKDDTGSEGDSPAPTITTTSEENPTGELENATRDLKLQEETSVAGEVRPTTESSNNNEKVKTESDACKEEAVKSVDPCAGNVHVFESLMKEENASVSSSTLPPSTSTTSTSSTPPPPLDGVYALNILQSPGPYPDGVDVDSREQYLGPDQFMDCFKLSIDDFKALPKWKQDNMKKKLNLF